MGAKFTALAKNAFGINAVPQPGKPAIVVRFYTPTSEQGCGGGS